nr:MAG TPA: hypothetical protein [Caudoviricetes sp.]
MSAFFCGKTENEVKHVKDPPQRSFRIFANERMVMIWPVKRKEKADVNNLSFIMPNHDKALKGACPKG